MIKIAKDSESDDAKSEKSAVEPAPSKIKEIKKGAILRKKERK